MGSTLTNTDRARQLARAIAADVRLYNEDKIAGVTSGDRQLELLAVEIAEGRELFMSRVSPEIQASGLYEQVIAEAFGASAPAEQPPTPRTDVAAVAPAPPSPLRFDEPVPGQEPGGSAYRQAELKALCLACKELAFATCRRCGAPFCGQHAPPRGSRCATCEAAYERREKRWGFSGWKTHLLLYTAIALGTLAFTGFVFYEVTGLVVVALMLAVVAVVLPFKLDRWIFLLERMHDT